MICLRASTTHYTNLSPFVKPQTRFALTLHRRLCYAGKNSLKDMKHYIQRSNPGNMHPATRFCNISRS